MYKIAASIILVLVPYLVFSQDIDILIVNNRYKEALEQINLQNEKHPTVELYYKQGLIYSRLQDYQNAILAYEKALELDSCSSEILCELGEANSVLGNNHNAIAYFERAVERDSANLPLAGKLGKTYINLKEFRSAYNVFSKIYSLDSTNVYWNRQLAYCASRLGKKDEAVILYEKVLVQNPKDLGTCLNLARLYQSDKQYDLALRKTYNGMRYFNKTLALNYYREYIREGGEEVHNLNYALERIQKIKEELFFGE